VANIKSQIKRNRQNLRRRLRNRVYRGAARTAVYQARAAVDAGAPDSKEAVLRAISILDKAAERGVLHPNNAARRKGRLMRHLAALSQKPSGMTAESPREMAEPAAPEITESAKKPGKKKPAAKKAAAKKPAAKTAKK